MTQLLTVIPKGTFQAVQYSGSTTHAQALQNWIETGTYRQPQISTQDIRTTTLKMQDGSTEDIEPGNYLLSRTLDGEVADFVVLPEYTFNKLFKIIN